MIIGKICIIDLFPKTNVNFSHYILVSLFMSDSNRIFLQKNTHFTSFFVTNVKIPLIKLNNIMEDKLPEDIRIL